MEREMQRKFGVLLLIAAISVMLLSLFSCEKETTPTVEIDRLSTEIVPVERFTARVTVTATVVCDGGDFVSSRGIVYSEPGGERTLERGEVVSDDGAGTGTFTVTFEVGRLYSQCMTTGNVTERTTRFWIAAFAANSQGPSYSQEETWAETGTWNTPDR